MNRFLDSRRARLTVLLALLTASAAFSPEAAAQVFDLGPSDPSLFDTVINLSSRLDTPRFISIPSPSFPNGRTLGGLAGRTIQLNVVDGGQVFRNLIADFGGEVNLSGGSIGSGFRAEAGSEVNVSGGSLDSLLANSGSVVNLSGGSFGRSFNPLSGSELNLRGGEFRLNGVPVSTAEITLSFGDLLTGTLADGSAFSFSRLARSPLNGVSLRTVALPALDSSPIVVDTPLPGDRPSGLRAGQTLTLRAGGELPPNFAVVDATLNITGGTIGPSAALARSVAEITGGSLGDWFSVYSGSVVSISDSTIGEGFLANSGSRVDISSGSIGRSFTASSDSQVSVRGGSFGRGFHASQGSSVNLSGGEFLLNGSPFQDPTLTLAPNDVFSGTLADGSPFIFSERQGDSLNNVSLTTVALPAIDTTPIVIDTPSAEAPSGLRAGQTLTLRDGGELGLDFAVVDGATLNVAGGAAESLTVGHGGVINISGGGGTQRLPSVSALPGSEVNISGGFVSPPHLLPDSELNLFVSDLTLDDQLIEGLIPGEAFTITNPVRSLRATLADGTSIAWSIRSFRGRGGRSGVFEPGSRFTVTLIPEPSGPLLLTLAATAALVRRNAGVRARERRQVPPSSTACG